MKLLGGQKIRSEALMLHMLFNLAVIALLFSGIQYYFAFMKERLWLTVLCCGFLLACVYAGRWICQRWYLQQKPFHFGLYTVLVLMGMIMCWPLVGKLAFTTPEAIVQFSVSTLPFFIIAFVMGMIIKLTRASMRKQIGEAELRAEQKQSELNLLQSQLSPHFLFNTLNNLYGIAITQHERMPPLLLQLSDLLRYSVYETNKAYISLKEELQYINNYISFEKLRLSDRLVLDAHLEIPDSNRIRLAPMVLIVFIENAFKHSQNTLDEKIYVNISLTVAGDELLFCVTNSYSETQKYERLEHTSGLGLANTVKRLNLLYEKEYALEQLYANNRYTVNLRLKIK